MITMLSAYIQVKYMMPRYRKRSISYSSYTRSFILIFLQQKTCLFRLRTNVISILKLVGFFAKLQLSWNGLSKSLFLQRRTAYSWCIMNRKYWPLQSVLSVLVRSTIGLLLTCLGACPLTSLVSTCLWRTGPCYCLFLLVVLKQLYIVG